jgi:hypothetical protein
MGVIAVHLENDELTRENRVLATVSSGATLYWPCVRP